MRPLPIANRQIQLWWVSCFEISPPSLLQVSLCLRSPLWSSVLWSRQGKDFKSKLRRTQFSWNRIASSSWELALSPALQTRQCRTSHKNTSLSSSQLARLNLERCFHLMFSSCFLSWLVQNSLLQSWPERSEERHSSTCYWLLAEVPSVQII